MSILISAHVIAEFMSSFIRETEWDMSNYRTWLAASKAPFRDSVAYANRSAGRLEFPIDPETNVRGKRRRLV